MTGSRTILGGILTICLVAGIIGASYTGAFFADTETSTGNTFEAGTIDLKIDLQCEEPQGCDFSLRDLQGQNFFHECDVKPGDVGEVTISWHVYDNPAWARLRFADIYDYENGCLEPEEDVDGTCEDPGTGDGELSQYLTFTLWMDEGKSAGWQCSEYDNGPCSGDLMEGDNILNGVETIFAKKTMAEIIASGGIELPGVLEPDYTYYLGFEWSIPQETGNIIQTDSLTGKIVMEVVQSRNNPTPWTS